MKRLIKNAAFKTFVALMAMLVLGALLSVALRSGSSPLTSALGIVMSPVQTLCASVADATKDLFRHFRSSAALQTQIAQQEGQIMELREKLVDYDDAKKKLELYEEFLELKQENSSYRFAEASVIGQEDEFCRTLSLNRGSTSGIAVNNPVLFGKYLVGVVAQVDLTSCTVQTLMNPAVSASVIETNTRTIGTCGTTVELSLEGLCCITGLERSTAITTGGEICTSGLGGKYPKDLIVGAVREVLEDSQGLSAIAVIEPAANIASLRDVFVLTNF